MADHDTRATPPSLLERIRDPRDAASWGAFVEVYAPLIYRYCRRRGLQDADAADVGQEVLAQVARSIRTFEYRPERGRFRDWLGRIARQRVARFLQRRDRPDRGTGDEGMLETLDAIAAPEADSDWTAEFHGRVLEAALERVRPRVAATTWQAFARSWLDGRPAAEVADELGLPIDAVYVARSRVLRRLRDEVLLLAHEVPPFAAPARADPSAR